MRIAIISDIHGNAIALEAVLEDLKHEAVDQLVCLGDAIQGGPQPAQVVARLKELACSIVMGNADDFLLTGNHTGAEPLTEARRTQLEAVREWQLTQLSEDDLNFIRTFQPTIRIPIDNERSVLCFHGSPQSYDDIILPLTPDEEVRQFLNPEQHTIYTGGHTHIQFMRHLGRTFHFNPGSVGLAYRHDQPQTHFRTDPWSEYAILTANNGRLSLEYRRVTFDVAQLIHIYRSSRRPFADIAITQYGD